MRRINRIELSDIDLDRFVTVKSLVSIRGEADHSRWVFRSPRGADRPVYLELWNPTYLRSNTLVGALEAEFYGPALTPGLRSVVFARGKCRGYVMEAGVRAGAVDPDPDFVRRLWSMTVERRWFANQYRPSHLRRVAAGVTLIDLEGVWRLDVEPVALHLHSFDDPDYERLVKAARSAPVSHSTAIDMADAHVAGAGRRRAAAAPFTRTWFARKGDSLSRRLLQEARNFSRRDRTGLLL